MKYVELEGNEGCTLFKKLNFVLNGQNYILLYIQGMKFTSCTTQYTNKLWCGTTEDTSKWGYCVTGEDTGGKLHRNLAYL